MDFAREVGNAAVPLDCDGNRPRRMPVLLMHGVAPWRRNGYYHEWPLLRPLVNMGHEWTSGDVRPCATRLVWVAPPTQACTAAAGGMSSTQATDRAKLYIGVFKKVLKRLGKSFQFSPTTPHTKHQARELWAQLDKILAEMRKILSEGLDWCRPRLSRPNGRTAVGFRAVGFRAVGFRSSGFSGSGFSGSGFSEQWVFKQWVFRQWVFRQWGF